MRFIHFAISINLLFALGGCITEKNTIVRTVIVNNTPYKLQITFYNSGVVLSNETKQLLPFEQKEVLYSHQRGKGPGLTYAMIIDELSDSCTIQYGDTVNVTHYAYNVTGANPSAIPFSNNRCIFKPDNYVRNIKEESRNSITNEYIYTITHEDYIYARDK